jgi:DNA-binding transcriptional ArsR family regulator
METKEAIHALAALAQQTRLAIFRLLVQAGPTGMSVGEIAADVQSSGATLSFHLKEMTYAGLIESRQDGRYIFYSAHYRRMNELLAFLTENCCAGDAVSCAPVCLTECAPTGPPKQGRAKPASGARLTKRRASTR